MTSRPSFYRLETDPSAEGILLARYIADHFLIEEDEASELIRFGAVHVEGKSERSPRTLLRGSQEIRVYWPRGGPRRTYEADPARITYRDAFLLAYDKEAGIPSQQTPSDAYNNLYAALQRYLEKEGRSAPYVALHHRLDRETSGIILFAVDREANRHLGNSFQRHRVTKDYLVWVTGTPEEEEWISSEDIGRKDGRYRTFPKGHGKSAETAFRVLHREGERTLVWARPKTGRTHQIRLHLAARGFPIAGDRLYGTKPAGRLYLHAFRLTLAHPITRARLALTAPVPPDWQLPYRIELPDESIP